MDVCVDGIPLGIFEADLVVQLSATPGSAGQ